MLNITYHDTTSVTTIDPLVSSVTISGDAQQAARKLSMDLQGTADGVTRLLTLEKGSEIRVNNNGKELFRGIIFADSIDSTGRMTVTAYDRNIYLTKNTDTRKFTQVTASGIIITLCSAFGIPIGTIEETGYVIPKMIFENRTLWDMMVMALTYTKKQTGKQFFIYTEQGRLCVAQFTKPTSRVVLEPGVNLINVTRDTSIEELVTRLRLYGKGKNNKTVNITVADDELVKKYGVMQALESPDSKTTTSAAKQKATTRLNELKKPKDELKIDALGIDDVVSGSAIYLMADIVGASGGYYVASDTHNYDGDTHTMSLRLSKTDVIPELKYA